MLASYATWPTGESIDLVNLLIEVPTARLTRTAAEVISLSPEAFRLYLSFVHSWQRTLSKSTYWCTSGFVSFVHHIIPSHWRHGQNLDMWHKHSVGLRYYYHKQCWCCQTPRIKWGSGSVPTVKMISQFVIEGVCFLLNSLENARILKEKNCLHRWKLAHIHRCKQINSFTYNMRAQISRTMQHDTKIRSVALACCTTLRIFDRQETQHTTHVLKSAEAYHPSLQMIIMKCSRVRAYFSAWCVGNKDRLQKMDAMEWGRQHIIYAYLFHCFYIPTLGIVMHFPHGKDFPKPVLSARNSSQATSSTLFINTEEFWRESLQESETWNLTHEYQTGSLYTLVLV